MTSTITITLVYEDTLIEEKTGEPGKFLFFSWTGYSKIKYRIYELKLLLPNGETKIIEIERAKFEYVYGRSVFEPAPINRMNLQEKTLRVINELEEEGYSVRQDQLALFMNLKITMLILQKKSTDAYRKYKL